ncbi:MAG: histidine kinase dimerization/phospho-acceptor domain-containing protein, partial [Pseudomonadota bacterium]
MTAPRVLPRLIVMLAAAVVAGLPAARAEAPAPVVVVEGRGVPALGERMRFARDTGQDLAAIVADHRAGRTDPDFAAVAGGIVPYQPVWGTVTLTRPAAPARPDRAQGPAALILVPDIYGIVALDAWVVAQARAPVPLLAHSIHAPFDAAAYSGTRLAAEPFRLAPGETAVLVVRMTFGPLLGRHFALETPAEHGLATYRAGIALALYYALMAACILFFFLFNLSLGNLLGLGYSAMLGLGLGFVGYLDGLALRFLYPDAPGWHLTIGIALLMAIAATGFRLAAATMDALGGRAWLGRAMRLGGWLALGGMGATLVVAPEITAPLSYVLTVAMIGAQAAAAFGWRNAVGRYVQVNRGLALIAFLAATVLLVMLLTGWGTEGLAVGWVLKGIYAVIALLIMAGLSISLIDLRDAHEAALRRELDAVQKEAETNRTLLEAERNYRRARDLADLRRQQLATASHDIRQPLTSLRMTLDAIAQDQEPGLRARLERAFDYIEDLSGAYLAESRPDADA